MTTHATLCFIKNNDKILLQKKAKGLYGEFKYNAPGGKLEYDELPETGVIREVAEETGLTVSDLVKHGEVSYYENGVLAWIVHVFSTIDFLGDLTLDHREGILEWIDIDKIPYDKMWANDKDWISLLLEGKKFAVEFYFDENNKLIKKEIKI
jgi:8-oxo-dGTP pyrophosphatase MutT (NUDIX family)